MTVGETLTEARNQAGLSVEDVSERTSIRDTVIRGIEAGDYAACGGDLYVRGYVRAIAGAVGLDAQPLIREYDEGQADDLGDHDLDEPALTPSGRHAVSYPRSDPGTESGSELDPDRTRFDLPPVPADPAATLFDLPPVPAAGQPPAGPATVDLMAAGYDLAPPVPPAPPAGGAPPSAPSAPPVPPAWATSPASPAWGAPSPPSAWGAPPLMPSGAVPPATAGDRRRKRRVLVAAAVVVVLLAVGGYLGISLGSGGRAPRSTAASSPEANAQPAVAVPGGSAAAGTSSAPASGSASGQSEAGTNGGTAGAVPLAVASAAAFGPDGTGDGDNSGQAGNALSGDASTSWSTEWYLTAKFGGLKSGTGLLLDLGRTVSVSSVKLVLSQSPGATVQLRAGNKASMADLRMVKSASGARGTVRLAFRDPARARYLLIWFTKLPPDGAGHYAESVSHVQVKGEQ